MSIGSTVESLEELKRKFTGWLDYNEINSRSYRWYTKEQWEEQGERPIGRGAVLTLVCEGALQSVCLGYTEEQRKLEEKMAKLIEHLGYNYDWGYSWSLHFYEED